MQQFLLAFTVLPVIERVARTGGGFYRQEYRPSHGTSLADALLAATAEEHGLSLVTFNRSHFPMISEVVVPSAR